MNFTTSPIEFSGVPKLDGPPPQNEAREETYMKKGMTRRELEITDKTEIRDILDRSKVLHLAMIDGDEPYVIAMNYGYTMKDDKLTIYLHGATAGRKLDILRVNPKVCFEMDVDVIPFEGKVPCQYGVAYSSIVGKGKAKLIEDVEEKKAAMTILMKTQTRKDFEFHDKLVSIVSVIKIEVDEYVAKHRPAPPR